MPHVRRALGWTAGWLLAAALAVAVGVLAVSTLGESIRDRGPIGDNELIRQADLDDGASTSPTPAPGTEAVRADITEEFGVLVVECRGVLAYGIDAQPDEAAGWRVVSFERGPDDDIDAVFARAGSSIDIEVFCNRGEPTVAELERHELPEDD